MNFKNPSSLNKQTFTVDDPSFNDVVSFLEKKYFHNGGGEEAEVIVNWHKPEVKEDGLVSIYATNSVLSSAIKRARPALKKVDLLQEGATLYFDSKSVRPLHMVLKVVRE
jgi:hypothetical protein